MAWENVATLVIALLALVVSVASARYSKTSAVASKRSADAAERQAAAAEAALPPPPPPVAWKVLPRGEASFLLRNAGTEPALDVEIHAEGERVIPSDGGELKTSELKPGQAISFWIFTADQLPEMHEIKVRWRDSNGWVILPLP